MGCCGKKRQELAATFDDSRATASPVNEAPVSTFARINGTAIFRYTGSSFLEVEGILGHRIYKFSPKDPELPIAAEDVALLRAYSDLIELKRVTPLEDGSPRRD